MRKFVLRATRLWSTRLSVQIYFIKVNSFPFQVFSTGVFSMKCFLSSKPHWDLRARNFHLCASRRSLLDWTNKQQISLNFYSKSIFTKIKCIVFEKTHTWWKIDISVWTLFKKYIYKKKVHSIPKTNTWWKMDPTACYETFKGEKMKVTSDVSNGFKYANCWRHIHFDLRISI